MTSNAASSDARPTERLVRCEWDPAHPYSDQYSAALALPGIVGKLDASCVPLLDDFLGTIADRARRPRHICHGVAQESVRRWSRESGLAEAARDDALDQIDWLQVTREGEQFDITWPDHIHDDVQRRRFQAAGERQRRSDVARA